MFGKRSVSNRLFTHGDAEARIKTAAWEFADEANEGQHGMRLVNKGTAVEVASRSLAKTKDQAFSVRQQHALKAVSEHISLVQTSKLINPASVHLDLLVIGHPLSTRRHKMDFSSVRDARARWYADDPRIVDTEVRSLVIKAFTASAGTPEHEYAAARLKAMGVAYIPIVAAAGFNDGANNGFWRRQLRNSKGQFAFMGGKARLLVGRNGKAYNQTGNIVSTDPERNTVILETPQGRLFEADADALEIGEVKALIPGKNDADGLSGTPAKTSASDTIVDEADMVFVDQPYGFDPVSTDDITMPKGVNEADVISAWEDEPGNYQVLKSDAGFILSRVELSGIVPISAHENWVGIQKAIDDDEPLFAKGKDAVAMIPQGELDRDPETARSVKVPVKPKPKPEPKSTTAPSVKIPVEPKKEDTSGFYETDRGPFFPEGSNKDIESGDFTDDPSELAQRYDEKEITDALTEAVQGGTGEGMLPFDDGDEFLPAEALYQALKTQGADADAILDAIEGKDSSDTEEPVAEIPEAEEEEPVAVIPEESKEEETQEAEETPAELTPADLRESGELPPLLEALTDEELQEIIDTGDYRKFLPDNEEFPNIPEGKYDLDGGHTPPGEVVSETPEPGTSNSPADLAMDMATETLEQLLRDAVDGVGGRPGYAQVTYLDSNGEEASYDVPAEFLREALQLQGIDTNEILREAYENNEPTPEEAEEMIEEEGVEEEPVAEVPTSAPSSEKIYKTKGWTKVGEQAGSNPGGLYEDENGKQFYVKFPKSDDHARNEVLASALYEAMGIPVGRVYLGLDDNEKTILVSPILDGVDGELNEFMDNPEVLATALKGFVPDAWLNNWDAVGLEYDNMLVKDEKVYRIDPGGSLFYRAQGKNKDMPDDVLLIESLRNPKMNQQSADVFKGMNDAELNESAKVVADLSEERIKEIVDEIFLEDPDRGEEILDILILRRKWIMNELDTESEPVAEIPDEAPSETAGLTPDELAAGWAWDKTGENTYQLDATSTVPVSGLISLGANGKWVLSEIMGDDPDGMDQDIMDIGSYDTAEEAFDASMDTVNLNGLFDMGAVQDLRESQEAEEGPEPELVVEADDPPPGSSEPVILDLDGDIEAQVGDAITNKKVLTFAYKGTTREVTPILLELSDGETNTNILTRDAEGKLKKFTVSKMVQISAVAEVEEFDSPGVEVPVEDAELPEAKGSETASQIDGLIALMHNALNPTTTDVENHGEGKDVDDDITDEAIDKLDNLVDEAETALNTAEKLIADAVQSALDGPTEDDDTPSTVDELEKASAAIDVDQSATDLIWQQTIDDYDGKVLPNGHIVVFSTMHDKRRFDVVVRRQNNNSFHIYHRVTAENGDTRIKEMGKNGWQSTKALFSKIDDQIGNARDTPAPIIKSLTAENLKTLYADTAKPKQSGSYVDSNNDVIVIGDRVTVTSKTHSKYKMGAKVNSLKRKKSVEPTTGIYTYTDYLSVTYSDGETNTIVAQSTTLQTAASIGTPTPAPGAPESIPSQPTPGNTVTYAQAESLLPPGAVIMFKDTSALVQKTGVGTYVEYKPEGGFPGKTIPFLATDTATVISLTGKTGGAVDVTPAAPTPAPAAPAGPPKPGPIAGQGPNGATSNPDGTPLSGKEVSSTGTSISSYTEESMVLTVQKTYSPLITGTSAFYDEFQGAKSFDMLNGWVQTGVDLLDGEKKKNIPKDKNNLELVPGVLVWVGSGRAIVSGINKYAFDASSPAGKIYGEKPGSLNVVMLSGPQAGKTFNNVNAKDLVSTGNFISKDSAQDKFNVYFDPSFAVKVYKGKETTIASLKTNDPDNVSGPGFDAPELEQLPSWDASATGTKTIESILALLADTANKDGADGYYTLVDGDSVEDLQIRVQRVMKGKKARIRITGRLTDWAGTNLIKNIKEGNPSEFVVTPTISLDRFKKDVSGELVHKGVSPAKYVDPQDRGASYTIADADGAKIQVFRAIDASQEDTEKVDFFQHVNQSTTPKAFHNFFDINLPGGADAAAIEKALATAGVQSSRPATDVDVKNLAENKLLTLFANLSDGTKNPRGALRQKELQKIKAVWGVTPEDVVLASDNTTQGRPLLRLPESVVKKIIKQTKLGPVHHDVYVPQVSGESSTARKQRHVDALVNILASGRLESTVSRHVTGDFSRGNSSAADVKGAGAGYVFLYMNGGIFPQTNMSQTYQIVFDPREVLANMGFTANSGDGWGKLTQSNTDIFSEIENRGHYGELMIKNNLSLSASVGVNMPAEMAVRTIAALRARGIDRIAGMSLEDYFALDVKSLKQKIKDY